LLLPKRNEIVRRKNRMFQASFDERLKLTVQSRIDHWIRICGNKQRQSSITGWIETENLNRYIRRIESFYRDLAWIAEKRGYKIHLVKEEAYHLHEVGEDLDENDADYRKWLFNYFFEGMDPSDYDEILRELVSLGYSIDYTNRYDFNSLDPWAIDVTMLQGEVILEAEGKWFVIGECVNNHAEIIYNSTIPGSHMKRHVKMASMIDAPEISVHRIYKPIFVIKNLKRLEKKLALESENLSVYCIDCGKKIIAESAQYCAECDKPVCQDCIVYCNKCKKPLCRECGYFGFCHDCSEEK